MSKQNFTVNQAHWDESKPLLRAIREAVFIVEQQVPKKLEWDDKDESALHVIAVNSDGHAIGTGRISATGQIGRMAVLKEWRNAGVGSALLKQLLKLAEREIPAPLFLNAQTGAIPFYVRHGFHCVGSEFVEAGIVHQRMELEQAPSPPGRS
ncbi:GNAT family N-acetyltransferase [Sedimenticola sp.]|uniref:GNAT family N-acetyltransferase n=1 Tax=Sedimenticola sp. TaxID=1940285 RepID=UPI003D0FDACF